MYLFKQITAAAILCASLTACSASNVLGLLSRSSPSVAANVQAGKTNVQAIGATEVNEQKIVRPQARKIVQSADDNQVTAETIRTVEVHQAVPPWIWITWAILFLLDSPVRWPGQIIAGFKKTRK